MRSVEVGSVCLLGTAVAAAQRPFSAGFGPDYDSVGVRAPFSAPALTMAAAHV